MSFDLQPVLQGKLVELRPLQAADYAELYAIAADPLIWEQHPASNRHEEAVFQEFFRDAIASRGALIALDLETRAAIGSSRFHGYDAERSEVEIGWTFLARSRWGGMYNGEMKQLMMQHAFRFVNCILFLVGSGNLRSQRAVEKIGGTRQGSEPDANGSYVYRVNAPHIFHIASAAAWDESAPAYHGDTLASEGFIHCSAAHQLTAVLNDRFRGATDLLLLEIDCRRVGPEIRYENLEGGRELFPHIYGPLKRDAILAATPLLADSSGVFSPRVLEQAPR